MMKELISKKELKEFGYIIAFGFPLLIGIIIPLITVRYRNNPCYFIK